MDHFAKLIAALVLSFAGTAHAGYALARPPSGWSPGNYAPSANDSVFGRVIHSPNGPTTIVGGQAVKMSASYRLAANAPRIAAGIIFANPYVRAGAAIASWLGVAGVVWNAVDNVWETLVEGDPPPNVLYRAQLSSGAWTEFIYSSPRAAAIAVVDWGNPVFQNCTGGPTSFSCTVQADAPWGGRAVRTVSVGSQSCPVGWNPTTAGCVQNSQPKRLTEDEFKDRLTPKPMPDPVPLELPPNSPLPIDLPFINPLPGPNPQPRPLFVPTGDPVPNPQYDPNAAPGPNNQPYIQPGVRIVPSPTTSQPWRVDYQPVNRPQADAMPKPNPEAEPGTDPADKPKPEEQQSLCEKHPDIVACAKLGEPGQATPVPNETKTLTIAPENGFGPSGASCPPPRTVQVAGLTLSMPFDLLCDFATGLKPVIVGLAWLSAAFTFMGIGRRS